MTIDNKARDANWKQIAAEFQSERDALRNDVLRMQQERDEWMLVANKLDACNRDIRAERDLLQVKIEGMEAYLKSINAWRDY